MKVYKEFVYHNRKNVSHDDDIMDFKNFFKELVKIINIAVKYILSIWSKKLLEII